MQIQRITLIGAGNVGYHLGQRFQEKGFIVETVFSRTIQKAKELAKLLGVKAVTTYKEVSRHSDIYIVAVKDDAIAEVARQLSEYLSEDALVFHTSGSVGSEAIQQYFPKGGVFYPLQTFSKTRKANFEQIPLCLHCEAETLKKPLEVFAQRIVPKVYWVNDEQRASLHVAAVIVNNFTNHLYQIGNQICEKEGVSFDLLKPLIQETAAKTLDHTPASMQTGPATRGDKVTIVKHLKYLQKQTEIEALYRQLSLAINPSLKDEI